MHNEEALHSTLRTVFMIFAIFWVVVIGVLLVAVGPLLKKWEKGGSHHGPGAHH